MIGSRDPAKLDAWLQDAGPAASAGTFAEAARFGDVVILSVRGSAAENVLESAGLDSFDAKVLIDASDPLDFSSGRPGLSSAHRLPQGAASGWCLQRSSSRRSTSSSLR